MGGTFAWNGTTLQAPMNRALFVDDHAEFWLTPTERAVTSPLTQLVEAQQGWGIQLNWDKVQMLTQPMGAGRKRRFPNNGRVNYAGHELGGHRAAKYLAALITKTATHGAEVSARITKAFAATVRVGRHVWRRCAGAHLKAVSYIHRTLPTNLPVAGSDAGRALTQKKIS